MRSYPHQSRKQLCEVSFLFGAVLYDAVVVVVECNCLFLWSNECVVASIRSVDIVSQRNEHFWGRNQYRRMHGWAILRANKKQSDKKFGWSLRTVGMYDVIAFFHAEDFGIGLSTKYDHKNCRQDISLFIIAHTTSAWIDYFFGRFCLCESQAAASVL